jgi:hypothetical protein
MSTQDLTSLLPPTWAPTWAPLSRAARMSLDEECWLLPFGVPSSSSSRRIRVFLAAPDRAAARAAFSLCLACHWYVYYLCVQRFCMCLCCVYIYTAECIDSALRLPIFQDTYTHNVCIHSYMYEHIHACIYIHTYRKTQHFGFHFSKTRIRTMNAYIHTCMNTYMLEYTYIHTARLSTSGPIFPKHVYAQCMHTFIHVWTHTCLHIHTYIPQDSALPVPFFTEIHTHNVCIHAFMNLHACIYITYIPQGADTQHFRFHFSQHTHA